MTAAPLTFNSEPSEEHPLTVVSSWDGAEGVMHHLAFKDGTTIPLAAQEYISLKTSMGTHAKDEKGLDWRVVTAGQHSVGLEFVQACLERSETPHSLQKPNVGHRRYWWRDPNNPSSPALRYDASAGLWAVYLPELGALAFDTPFDAAPWSDVPAIQGLCEMVLDGMSTRAMFALAHPEILDSVALARMHQGEWDALSRKVRIPHNAVTRLLATARHEGVPAPQEFLVREICVNRQQLDLGETPGVMTVGCRVNVGGAEAATRDLVRWVQKAVRDHSAKFIVHEQADGLYVTRDAKFLSRVLAMRIL